MVPLGAVSHRFKKKINVCNCTVSLLGGTEVFYQVSDAYLFPYFINFNSISTYEYKVHPQNIHNFCLFLTTLSAFGPVVLDGGGDT